MFISVQNVCVYVYMLLVSLLLLVFSIVAYKPYIKYMTNGQCTEN